MVKRILVGLGVTPFTTVALQIAHFKEGSEKELFLLKVAAEFCDAHGFEVKTDAVEGRARSDLLPVARENVADLIVMGNSVNKALLKRLLADTVLDTIKSADRPLFLSQ